MKKIISIFALSLIAGALLVGCGGPAAEGENATNATPPAAPAPDETK